MGDAGDDLFTRAAFSDEIAVLRAAFPREAWERHPNLGPLAHFWLERHAMFRTLGETLSDGAATLREGGVEPKAFASWFAPRIRLFLGELNTHHAVEDHHYFPVFKAADRRLARGFEILDRDHHALDALIHDLAAASNDLFGALRAGKEARPPADTLCRQLMRATVGIGRHLDDEEDLVVPLILERTEGGLGVA